MGIVFTFAGQGSQYPGMAARLYEHDPAFREEFDALDATLTRMAGRGIRAVLWGGRSAFDIILDTHPALFVVQCALARSLMRRGLVPDFVLGLSTGEFAAAAIGGAVPLDDALYSILQQARVLAEACPRGGMLAVVRPPSFYRQAAVLYEQCSLALEARSYFVVSGPPSALDEAVRQLTRQGIAHRSLPVDQGFHSPLIDPARRLYLDAVAGREPGSTGIPLVSCALAGIVEGHLDADHLWRAISDPMRFLEAIDLLARHGSHVYVDLGPGSTLSILLRQSGVELASVHTLLSPQGDELRSLHALLGRTGSALTPPVGVRP